MQQINSLGSVRYTEGCWVLEPSKAGETLQLKPINSIDPPRESNKAKLNY